MFSACCSSFAVERHHADLGHAVHDVGDLFAELGVNLFERDFRVLDRIVQQPGGHRMGVETELGKDFGHGQRMREIGFAGKPHLPGMGAAA